MLFNSIKLNFVFSLIFLTSILIYSSKEESYDTFEYRYESLLDPYNENQLFEWQPKKLSVPNPSHWAGELGYKYIVPEDEETYNKLFRLHEFNVLASDRIAFNRTLKDYRIKSCKSKQMRRQLPNTSVIIVFHNEAFSTLVRTVQSVIKTSSNLLLEIILVDDSSTKVYLRRQLEDYVNQLSVPVRVMRLGKRSGLIQARLLGSAHARGQVFTFLDAHCECNEGWLESLLNRIAGDRTRVVSPIIDIIDDKDFHYSPAGDMIYGGFNWKIGFRWMNAPQSELKRRNNNRSLPLRSPTLSGGLFAIDREFFEYIGKYDPGMIIWGAENLEFSFRVWMCGGSIEIDTCSRVGHVFRNKTPYTLPGGSDYVVWHNTARLVDVWLDEWKHFYYALHPGARDIDRGSIERRVLLREQRKCKSFKWYLDDIYPESVIPNDYYFLGDIRNMKTKNLCLDSVNGAKNSLVLNECSLQHFRTITFSQLFVYSKQNQIQNDENCLEVNDLNQTVVLDQCLEDYVQQQWVYNEDTLTLRHSLTDGCLDIKSTKKLTELVVKECKSDELSQKWILRDNFEWQSPTHTL